MRREVGTPRSSDPGIVAAVVGLLAGAFAACVGFMAWAHLREDVRVLSEHAQALEAQITEKLDRIEDECRR